MLEVLTFARSASSAVSFVTGDAFLTALDAIGGVHMQAAQDAFRKVPHSHNPREAMNRALCHLEAAHVAFRGWWSSSTAQFFRLGKCVSQAQKDVNTCSLIALIHHLLGDDQSLVSQAIRHAEEAHEAEFPSEKPVSVKGVFGALASGLNPLIFVDAAAIKNQPGETYPQRLARRRGELEELKKHLLGS